MFIESRVLVAQQDTRVNDPEKYVFILACRDGTSIGNIGQPTVVAAKKAAGLSYHCPIERQGGQYFVTLRPDVTADQVTRFLSALEAIIYPE